ncbi:MAG: hypothetical protein AB7V26_13320 [Lysobacterales bacterium]
MNTFPTLLKREFWEHKGGFLWAPIVASAVFLALTLMAMITAEVVGNKTGFQVNGIHLAELTKNLGPKELLHLSAGLDFSFLMAAAWPYTVLAFVVFFYCLGTLFDERRDRSVLFWKSLPLSDRDTVLSKVASALLVAPLIATAVAILTGFGFYLLLSAFVLFHGGSPLKLLWGPASPLASTWMLVGTLPVYAIWALPTVGWLLLCSAWAKSKPFLWALMIPVLSGVLVTWFDVMRLFSLKTSWYWSHVVGRLLGSTWPGADMVFRGDFDRISNINQAADLQRIFSVGAAWAGLADREVWIGAILGIAMIVAATRLRRWRDEG